MHYNHGLAEGEIWIFASQNTQALGHLSVFANKDNLGLRRFEMG
jgi:hypothetical protein